MNRFTLLCLALVACKGDVKPAADKPVAAAAKAAEKDPWLNANDKPAVKLPDDLAKLAEIAKDGPNARDYPQADSVVALDRDDITLGDDGTVVEKHHSIVKILDAQRGKEKFADLHVPFDRKRQTLTIDIARTVTVDGEAHVASPDEIGDIVPSYLADATMYSDVRERVISFPAVDTGSVVELVWTRTTKATPDSAQGGEALLAQWNPVISRIVTITTPTKITPKLATSGTSLKPVETTSGTTHTYTLTVDKLPDAHREMGQPGDFAVLPRVVYGFQPDWNHVLEPVADRFLRIAIPEVLPPAIVTKAHELVATAKDDAEKARLLYAFVSRDIREVSLPLGAAGYEPHAPDVVLANRYGDVRDKVGLLLALCAAEKIQGRPILVRTGTVPVLPQVPTLAQFDQMVAKLTVDGKDVWLAPSDEYGQYGLAYAGQDNLVLPLARGGAELGKRELLDPSTSVSHVSAKYTLADNGDLDAVYSYQLSGSFANAASRSLRPLKGDNLVQFFQSQAANVSAGAVDKGHTVGDALAVSGPLAIEHHVSAPGYAQSQGTFRVLELPPPTLDFATDLPPSGMSVRKYALYIGTPKTHVSDVSVVVPAGWKVSYVPPDLKGNAEGMSYDEHCATVGQTVTCHAELVVNKVTLAADSYVPFHDAMAKLGAYERRIVLLTKS